jgi:hypothetical protein
MSASTSPVYSLELVYFILRAGPDDVNLVGAVKQHLLPPGEHLRELPRTVIERWDPARPPTYLRVRMSFVDARGRRWRRGHDGVLTDQGLALPIDQGDETLPW